MSKTYTIENVVYGARGPRWRFYSATHNYSYETPTMPGGHPTAEKVARRINGSLKRCGRMDNLARSNIHDILMHAKKTLVEHQP